MKPFKIENLEIRRIMEDDWDTIADFNSKNLDKLSDNGFSELPTFGPDVERWTIEGKKKEVYGIFDGPTAVGFIGIETVRMKGSEHAGVWYALDYQHQKKGVVSESVARITVEYLQKYPDLADAMLHCLKRNTKSSKLAERIGMTPNEDLNYQRQFSARSFKTMEGWSATVEDIEFALGKIQVARAIGVPPKKLPDNKVENSIKSCDPEPTF